MIIKEARVSLLRAPLIQPFRIATGQHDILENALLALTLADGTVGYGEAAVATHITGETVAKTLHNLKIAAGHLIGQELGDYLELCGQVQAVCVDNKAAAAAVEMALFDALTRHVGIPLWRLWGKTPTRLATDITIVISSVEESAARARQWQRQGFRAFKIKIGEDLDRDFKRVQAVAAVVRHSTLILDANQGYSAQDTLKFLKMLAKAQVKVDLIEQPVPKADWEGLKRVTRSTKVLVCADESVSSVPQAFKAIKEKAVGAINLKLMKTGIVQAVAIARWAKAGGIKLMMGGMMESPLAMTAAAQVAAGLGGFDFIDLDTPFFIKDGLKDHPFLNRRGVYDLSKCKAGIGIRP